MEILLATGNQHKKEEISRILPHHQIITPDEAGLEFSFDETGITFAENALGKALHLHRLSGGKPVLADDSGLCVEALDGAPGVYSARYGSRPGEEPLETSQRNALLLKAMKHKSNRKAFFVCAMVLVLGEFRHYTIQETVEGEIAREPFGGGGFGYDPMFFLPDRKVTMAQLSEQEKNKISHRGRAGIKTALLLNSLSS